MMYAATAYVFTMLALYMLGSAKLVEEEGRPRLFLVFLPFAHEYVRAVIAGQRGRYLRVLAPLATANLIFALMISNIYFLAAALLFNIVTRIFLNYYTYERKNAMLFTLLGLLIPLSSGIWLYYTYRKVRIPL